MELSIYFPHLSDEQLAVMSCKADYISTGLYLNEKANEESDVLCPYDEVEKRRSNVLTKVMDPNVNPLERERLMASLQRIPASKRNNLSDEDKIRMLPSRYNQTMTDDDKYANYMSDVVEDYNESESSEDISETANESNNGSSAVSD